MTQKIVTLLFDILQDIVLFIFTEFDFENSFLFQSKPSFRQCFKNVI